MSWSVRLIVMVYFGLIHFVVQTPQTQRPVWKEVLRINNIDLQIPGIEEYRVGVVLGVRLGYSLVLNPCLPIMPAGGQLS